MKANTQFKQFIANAFCAFCDFLVVCVGNLDLIAVIIISLWITWWIMGGYLKPIELKNGYSPQTNICGEVIVPTPTPAQQEPHWIWKYYDSMKNQRARDL